MMSVAGSKNWKGIDAAGKRAATLLILLVFTCLLLSMSRVIAEAQDEVPPYWEEVPSDWYNRLAQNAATEAEANALSEAAKIAKDRVTVYQNVDGWTIRVPDGESCNETAVDLAHAFMQDPEFQGLTEGWEVHNVAGPVGILGHSTTVLVPPKPPDWRPSDPYRAYLVDNYTGSVGVEPVTGYWDSENQQTYYSFPPRPYGVNPPTSLVRSLFNLNTYGAEETKLTQLGGIANYDGTTPSGKVGVSAKNDGIDPGTGEVSWGDLPAELPLFMQLKKYNDSAPDQDAKMEVNVGTSVDPNEISGPNGVGAQRYVRGSAPFVYTIFFENLASASANAQTVVVTDTLDPEKFDLVSFHFGPVSAVGGDFVPYPLPMTSFTGRIDLRPENDVVVEVHGEFDTSSGLVTWTFRSLDPHWCCGEENPACECEILSGELVDSSKTDAGLLKPGEGGSVSFTVMPKPDLESGTIITNGASIVFDTNAPIVTNIWSNTVDTLAPQSQVSALASIQRPISRSFQVTWSGSDAGSGIDKYFVLVSKDGGPYQPWMSLIEAMSATFSGGGYGTYRFYALARDKVGNMEDTLEEAEAHTKLLPSGDIDNDGDVDRADLNIVLANRNKTVANSTCGEAGDMDWDGKITVLDARILVTLFTRPGGAIN